MSEIIGKNISVAGCVVHCLEAGKRGRLDIILLHGMKFQAETWRQLGTLEILARAGFHVLALDLPGFGLSPQGNASPGAVLTAFIKELQLEKPVLLGPSMGGRVALEFCLDEPEAVGAMILVGPVGIPENKGRLSMVGVPVLAIWGGEDTISPLDNGAVLEKETSGCRLVVIEGAPHPCYLEHTERFHGEILSFLSSI